MKEDAIYSRYIISRLKEALTDTPVVLIHGPRQCGKTTLAQQIGKEKGYTYLTFDDDIVKASAEADPTGFVARLPEKVILDEVQRVPQLFTAIKSAIDRDRKPGKMILTGSANVLLIPKLADSLAGRLEVLRLHPLSRSELYGNPSVFLKILFAGQPGCDKEAPLGRELADFIAEGGFPAAIARSTNKRKAAWYRGYVDALVQRDVQDMARIQSLEVLPRLLAMAASQTARLVNITEMASPFGLSRPTIQNYITLLERLFLLESLPPWHSNRLSRLIKTPKLHLTDSGLACALLGVDASAIWEDRKLLGQMLETFVCQEIRRMASWQEDPIHLYHYRDKDGAEVDLVLETIGQRLAGIEIKASSSVTLADFKGLSKLREVTKDRFSSGVVLYDGKKSLPFGDRLWAVPIRTLWQGA